MKRQDPEDEGRTLRMKELPRELLEGDGGCVTCPDWLGVS